MFKIGDKDFMRRGLEGCGLAFLLCLLLAPGAFTQKPPVSHMLVKQTAPESLTLIKPSDPAFEGMIDTYYPGLSQEEGYQKSIRPFLVLVRNDTSLPAVAYAITWAVHYAGGPVASPSAVFVNRPLMERRSLATLLPGEIRLVSPTFNVTPEEYAQSPAAAQTYPALGFRVRWGAGSTSIDVAMDGVFYAGGKFIGPDKTHVFERYVLARFAARDEALAALKLINSSKTAHSAAEGRLNEMLGRDYGLGNRARADTLMALYVRDRGRAARGLLQAFQARGLAGLKVAIQVFVNRSRGKVKPSMFGRVYEGLSDNDPRVFWDTP